MSDRAPDVAGRLEEIDRRLREIQAELVPGRVPRETRVPVNPSDSDSDSSTAPDVEPDVAAAGDAPPEPGPAPHVVRDDSAAAPRGRSGPLAEALQRARSARVAGLTTPPPPPSEPPAPEPPPPARPAAPAPPPAHDALRHARLQPDPRVDVLAELQSSLLTATRDLLDGYERASFTASERRANRVTISAGPFKGTKSLHSFEQELSALPGVHGVDVRGYEGADRAIIEVELETPDER